MSSLHSEAPGSEDEPGFQERASLWASVRFKDVVPCTASSCPPFIGFEESRHDGPGGRVASGSHPARGRSSSPQAHQRPDGPTRRSGRTTRSTRPYMMPADELYVKVQQQYVGYILGRGGQKIKELQKNLHVKMEFDQSTHEEGYSTLTIRGGEAAVDYVKVHVNNLIQQYDSSCERGRQRGRSLSESGRAEGRATSGSSTWFRSKSRCSDTSEGDETRVVHVVPVEQTYVGAVIGKKGSTLKLLEMRCNVQMDFNRAADEQGFQKLRIAGDRRAVKDAKAGVCAIISGCGGDPAVITNSRLRHRDDSADTAYSDSDFGGRRALAALVGRWYHDENCYEVWMDGRGRDCGLTCASWSIAAQGETVGASSVPRRSIYYEGSDIFLGERCRYYLNVISEKTVTWVDESNPRIILRWSKGREGTATRGKSSKSYGGYFQRSKERDLALFGHREVVVELDTGSTFKELDQTWPSGVLQLYRWTLK
eukprot:g32674.t1